MTTALSSRRSKRMLNRHTMSPDRIGVGLLFVMGLLARCSPSQPKPTWRDAGSNVAYAVSAICAPYVLDGLDPAHLPRGRLVMDDGWREHSNQDPGSQHLRVGFGLRARGGGNQWRQSSVRHHLQTRRPTGFALRGPGGSGKTARGLRADPFTLSARPLRDRGPAMRLGQQPSPGRVGAVVSGPSREARSRVDTPHPGRQPAAGAILRPSGGGDELSEPGAG